MSQEWILGIATGVLISLVVVIIRAVSRWMARTISSQVVDLIGDSLQDRWRKDIDEALEPIHAELKTNGGTSLKDQVSSISLRMGNVESQIEAVLSNQRE